MKKLLLVLALCTLSFIGGLIVNAQNTPPVRYVVFHKPGPSWQAGVDFRKQPGVQGHVMHYMQLLEQGKLAFGGPFLDNTGGMMIPIASVSLEEIQAFAESDPAVKSGLLTVEIKPWMVAMEQD